LFAAKFARLFGRSRADLADLADLVGQAIRRELAEPSSEGVALLAAVGDGGPDEARAFLEVLTAMMAAGCRSVAESSRADYEAARAMWRSGDIGSMLNLGRSTKPRIIARRRLDAFLGFMIFAAARQRVSVE
jgi:hypothetical protein